MEDRKKMTPEERQHYESKLLKIMMSHTGKTKMIGMGELYTQVFDDPWSHRINDTRRLRSIITGLRKEGVPICSVAAQTGGGYYTSSAGSELTEYLGKLRAQGIRKLALEAHLRRMSLAELLGQAQLELMGSGV